MYYLRTRSAAPPIQFTVDQKVVQQVKEEKQQMKKKVLSSSEENEVDGEVEQEQVNGVEDQREGEVPMVDGKVDTESQAYKDAVLACSRENREACTMCSA